MVKAALKVVPAGNPSNLEPSVDISFRETTFLIVPRSLYLVKNSSLKMPSPVVLKDHEGGHLRRRCYF